MREKEILYKNLSPPQTKPPRLEGSILGQFEPNQQISPLNWSEGELIYTLMDVGDKEFADKDVNAVEMEGT